MDSNVIMVPGVQTKFHKLLITAPKKEKWGTVAALQMLNEDRIITLEMPLEAVLEKLAGLGPGTIEAVAGNKTDDCLVMRLLRPESELVRLTAVRGGANCLAANFNRTAIKLAIESAIIFTGK